MIRASLSCETCNMSEWWEWTREEEERKKDWRRGLRRWKRLSRNKVPIDETEATVRVPMKRIKSRLIHGDARLGRYHVLTHIGLKRKFLDDDEYNLLRCHCYDPKWLCINETSHIVLVDTRQLTIPLTKNLIMIPVIHVDMKVTTPKRSFSFILFSICCWYWWWVLWLRPKWLLHSLPLSPLHAS